MRNNVFFISGFIIILSLLFGYVQWSDSESSQNQPTTASSKQFTVPETGFPLNVELKVALVFNQNNSNILAAYQQILTEEGFPYELVPDSALLKYSAKKLKEKYGALIFPEEINQKIAPSTVKLVEEYVLQAGGKVFLGVDAGAVDDQNAWRAQELFSTLTGARYRLPDLNKKDPSPGDFHNKGILFIPASSPLRSYFDPGLFVNDILKVNDYPVVEDGFLFLSDVQASILAYFRQDVFPEGEAVLQKNYPGGGMVLWVNGRPGLLKSQENIDFVLRSLLKYFLLEMVRLPRLVAAPGGTGGLVVAIHICSGAYFRDLDHIFAQKLLSSEILFSFFVTAGPDNDRSGDGRGVDILNPKKGGRYVDLLSRYGNIGSHGGWIHNYWSYHYENLSPEEKKKYIDLNYQALEAVTGHAVTEYAAPGGSHDAEANDFLAAWKTKAVSVPLAFHSPPTHGWFNGSQEKRFWLFGYTGTQSGTAFENMLAKGRKPQQITTDIEQLINTVVEKREIRLLYFHPVSIARHPDMWRAIQSYLLKQATEGNLSMRTMSDFADFLDRHQSVRFSVRKFVNGYSLQAISPFSLKEMTFALPLEAKAYVKRGKGLRVREKNGWAYITILDDKNKVELQITFLKKAA